MIIVHNITKFLFNTSQSVRFRVLLEQLAVSRNIFLTQHIRLLSDFVVLSILGVLNRANTLNFLLLFVLFQQVDRRIGAP